MIGRSRHLASVLALAALGVPVPFGSAPIPDTSSREPQRRSTSTRRERVANPVREQRAADKRARKAAKRLQHITHHTTKPD